MNTGILSKPLSIVWGFNKILIPIKPVLNSYIKILKRTKCLSVCWTLAHQVIGGSGGMPPPPPPPPGKYLDSMCSEVLYILRLFELSLSTHVVHFNSMIIVHSYTILGQKKFIFKSQVLVVPLLHVLSSYK